MQLRILADDVTGAADSAARVHACGLAAQIVLGAAPSPAPALALTTDSRHLAPDRAASAVQAAVAAYEARGALWYKKIDSTLRGNLAVELDAMLDAARLDAAVVCPAFPAHGRALVGGRLHALGVAANGVDLLALLAMARRPALHVPLELVRAGSATLAAHLAALGHTSSHLVVADAATDEDLVAIEAATARALPHALRCGSSGLVGTLARRLVAEGAGGAGPRAAVEDAAGPSARVLVVVGSGSRAAHRQVAHLRERGACTVEHPVVPSDATSAPLVVLHLPPPPEGAMLDGAAARAVAGMLAADALGLIERLDPGLVVLCGGDTAMAVLGALGVPALTVLRELLPGMPLAHGVDRGGRARRFILKPGSFGRDDALAELLALAAR